MERWFGIFHCAGSDEIPIDPQRRFEDIAACATVVADGAPANHGGPQQDTVIPAALVGP